MQPVCSLTAEGRIQMWGDHSQSGCGIAGSLLVFCGGSLTQPACVSTVPAVSTTQQLILLVWDQGWNIAVCFGSRESLREGLPTSSTSVCFPIKNDKRFQHMEKYRM